MDCVLLQIIPDFCENHQVIIFLYFGILPLYSLRMPFFVSLVNIFFIGPKSDHCLVLSVIETALFELCSKFVKIVKWIFIGPRSDHSLLM